MTCYDDFTLFITHQETVGNCQLLSLFAAKVIRHDSHDIL